MLTESQERLVDKLWNIGAVKFDFDTGYRLKMHDDHPERPLSPIYLNLRTDKHPVPEKRGPLDDETMLMIGDEFGTLLDQWEWNFDLYVDIPDAGAPFGDQIESMLTWLTSPAKSRLRLVKIYRDDDTRLISHIDEGCEYELDQEVLVVDDLLTGADTKLEAAKVLRAAGLNVWLILVLIDRCQGGMLELNRQGLDTVAVMTLPDMLQYYVRTRRITREHEQDVLDYLELASTW